MCTICGYVQSTHAAGQNTLTTYVGIHQFRTSDGEAICAALDATSGLMKRMTASMTTPQTPEIVYARPSGSCNDLHARDTTDEHLRASTLQPRDVKASSIRSSSSLTSRATGNGEVVYDLAARRLDDEADAVSLADLYSTGAISALSPSRRGSHDAAPYATPQNTLPNIDLLRRISMAEGYEMPATARGKPGVGPSRQPSQQGSMRSTSSRAAHHQQFSGDGQTMYTDIEHISRSDSHLSLMTDAGSLYVEVDHDASRVLAACL